MSGGDFADVLSRLEAATPEAADPAGPAPDSATSRLVLITGRAGAGRTTAINVLEDVGFERVDTPPLAFVPAILKRLIETTPRRVAIGVHARTLDFSVENFLAMRSALDEIPGLRTSVVFLDGHDECLRRRYTETRRRHPMSTTGTLEEGLDRDRAAMLPLRAHAEMVIDTSDLAPAELRRALQQHLDDAASVGPTLSILSFAYKRGLPIDADMVFDCRFLRNPHYEPSMRQMDGGDAPVRDYIKEDARYAPFFEALKAQAALLLPAFQAEGKSYVTIAFGCTGGRHRSVALAEAFADVAASLGWRPLVRHRELDRLGGSNGTGAA